MLSAGNGQPSSASASSTNGSAASQESNPITIIDRRLLGQSVDKWDTEVLNNTSRKYHSIEVATGLRGPGNALIADFYNWKDPLGLNDARRRKWINVRPPSGCANDKEWKNQLGTLDYLRLGRDKNAALTTLINTRGFPNWFYWPNTDQNPYVASDLEELKQLASDWILYTHYTVRNFDQSHLPSAGSTSPLEQRSAVVLSELRWQNCDGTSVRPVLPLPGEGLPEINYWEIGNEPNFPLAGFDLSPAQYATRYGVLNTSDPNYTGITNSMIDMDILIHGQKTIKVGPTLMGNSSNQSYLQELKNSGAHLDFVSYHPYTSIFGYWYSEKYTQLPNIAAKWDKDDYKFLRDKMSRIYGNQNYFASQIRNFYPDVELLATEWNPTSWEGSWTLYWREKSMAQALGVMETVFSFARIGVSQAHFYTLPTANESGAHITNPAYKTMDFMQDQLFDNASNSYLLASYDNDSPATTNYRGYAAQNSSSGRVSLWGLNWGTASTTIDFSLDLSNLYSYTMTECYQLSAPSILAGSINDPMAPPLTEELQIVQTPMSLTWNNGQINYSMTVPHSTWIACFLTRAPGSSIFSAYLPVITNNSK
jgi:hypothetical protein